MRRFGTLLLLAIAMLGVPQIAAAQAGTPPAQQSKAVGNPDVKVWVNTKSGVYWCPGTRYYGNTKQGGYMTQKEAQEKGDRPAYGKACSASATKSK